MPPQQIPLGVISKGNCVQKNVKIIVFSSSATMSQHSTKIILFRVGQASNIQKMSSSL